MKQKKWKMVAKLGDKVFGTKYCTDSKYKNSPWLFVIFCGKQTIPEYKYRENFSKYSDIRGKRIHKETKSEYDNQGYNKYGYNELGYNKKGLDYNGYDKDGYDKNGYDKYDFNREGINKDT